MFPECFNSFKLLKKGLKFELHCTKINLILFVTCVESDQFAYRNYDLNVHCMTDDVWLIEALVNSIHLDKTARRHNAFWDYADC